MKHKKSKNYPYPHIRPLHSALSQKIYEEHKKEYDSWSEEERQKRRFKHPHPRRLYIFLDRYFELLKYMPEDDKVKYVFPWVCATRSERINAIKKHIVYFKIVKKCMKIAQQRKELMKLKNNII